MDEDALEEHQVATAMTPSIELFQDSNTPRPPFETNTNLALDRITDNIDLSNQLFFIQYTPEGTLRRRWYLIQVDMESTLEVNPDFASNGLFWCVFLARHPSDHKRSDEYCRWWPDWYKFTHCIKTNDMIYGDRVLIRPNTTPCSTKFVQWAALLPLRSQDSISLAGPFTFEPITPSNRVRQKVEYSNWLILIDACTMLGITPPSIGITHSPKKQPVRIKNQKKRKR